MKTTTLDAILRRIRARGRGFVFSQKDFIGIGDRAVIDQSFARLARRRTIRRLARGLYDYPRVSKRIGLLSPDPDVVADALARKTNATLQTTGALAANRLGLSTQVPAKNVYLTNGTPKRVTIGRQTIELRRVSPSKMADAGTLTGDALQALRYLGRHGVDDVVARKLRSILSSKDKKRLQHIANATAPTWVCRIADRLSTSG